MYTLPKLPYPYDALEPHIDAQTMEIHYTKHHQGYVDKLNAALEGYKELQKKSAEDLLKNIDSIPANIRTAVRNQGGGHVNHSLFWTILKKDVEIKDRIKEAINDSFGSFEKFKEQFSKAAAGLFGRGWSWLGVNGGKLEFLTTSNQDNPI